MEPEVAVREQMKRQQMLQPRSYQQEMIDLSMKQNIIVAMDTGSGKTAIAIGRIREELLLCAPEKIVWFLAPSVALCLQQHHELVQHITPYNHRCFSGSDNTDKWTDQKLWDAILFNVRIVVSTPQILYDALAHGFVKITNIALLVFDEAHRCLRNTPMHRIMADFYHSRFEGHHNDLPHVLGLTASPVLQVGRADMDEIERILDATIKTPKIHRDEMAQYVHQPVFEPVFYPASTDTSSDPSFQLFLSECDMVLTVYDIEQDPFLQHLYETKGIDAAEVKKVLHNRKTYSTKEIRSLRARAMEIDTQLGTAAVYWFLNACLTNAKESPCHDHLAVSEAALRAKERAYLYNILADIIHCLPIPDSVVFWQTHEAPPNENEMTPKLCKLLDLLSHESHRSYSGLIFVKQRATVAVLDHIIKTHPKTRDHFFPGTFVGSTYAGRQASISDLAAVKDQQQVLLDFKDKDHRMNLIITTSVLEEGIDIPACHSVICFDPPDNLVSFVQRRGRARRKDSRFIVFLPSGHSSSKDWDKQEAEMKEAYANREPASEENIEDVADDSEEMLQFRVPSTDALLTTDNATSHLYHFCQTISRHFTDSRPQYTTEIDSISGMKKVTITLPTSVEASLRVAESSKFWKSERMASKDASFQAYMALYHAGLVNDNLLPLTADYQEEVDAIRTQEFESIVIAAEIVDPWLQIAHKWRNATTLHRTLVQIRLSKEETATVRLLLPCALPKIPAFPLYWNKNTQYQASLETMTNEEGHILKPLSENLAQSFTYALHHTALSAGLDKTARDFTVLCMPDLPITTAGDWITSMMGEYPATELVPVASPAQESWGIIRDQMRYGAAYTIVRTVLTREVTHCKAFCLENQVRGPIEHDEQWILAERVSRRRDYLHRVLVQDQEEADKTREADFLRAKNCTVDRLPASLGKFARMLPSVLHMCELYLIAERLQTTLLSPLSLTSLDNILTAICASSAQEHVNCQRLEFLGDCILKLHTTIDLMNAHPTWPESYLTKKKSTLVSNQTLAKAAVAAGLDSFIVTKGFTGHKWRPHYNSELLQASSQETRQISSKVLADVVEALIGAAYLDGTTSPFFIVNGDDMACLDPSGLPKAVACASLLMPRLCPTLDHTVLHTSTSTHPPGLDLTALEHLLGYTFTDRTTLLTALTHPSFTSPTAASYERLEFLGDAVLDHLITSHLVAHTPPLSHRDMHTLRTLVANADFLAYLSLECAVLVPTLDIVSTPTHPNTPTPTPTTIPHPLWHHTRHSSPALVAACRAAEAAHAALRPALAAALARGPAYPWPLLARARAPKFLSDLIESLLGAVHVDSRGDFAACARVARRCGLFRYLGRWMASRDACADGGRGSVRLLHPKEELGRLAGDAGVEYKVVPVPGVGQTAEVRVGGEVVGEVEGDGGATRLEMETWAADAAVRRMLGEPAGWDEL